jgi:hypothetical protein
MPGVMAIDSPFGKLSFKLSSSTEFRFSTH